MIVVQAGLQRIKDVQRFRLIAGVGQQGGDVLVEQKIDGSSDDVQFTFGNADRELHVVA